MPKSPKTYGKQESKIDMKPPESVEEAEKMCISLSYNLVMQRLKDGTATSQETTHFLKLATQKEKNENELARARIEKEKAQAESIKKAEHDADLMERAIQAFKGYSGIQDEDDQDIY